MFSRWKGDVDKINSVVQTQLANPNEKRYVEDAGYRVRDILKTIGGRFINVGWSPNFLNRNVSYLRGGYDRLLLDTTRSSVTYTGSDTVDRLLISRVRLTSLKDTATAQNLFIIPEIILYDANGVVASRRQLDYIRYDAPTTLVLDKNYDLFISLPAGFTVGITAGYATGSAFSVTVTILNMEFRLL